MASYNTYTTPDQTKRESIANILGRDRADPLLMNYLGLDQLFTWSCNSVSGK